MTDFCTHISLIAESLHMHIIPFVYPIQDNTTQFSPSIVQTSVGREGVAFSYNSSDTYGITTGTVEASFSATEVTVASLPCRHTYHPLLPYTTHGRICLNALQLAKVKHTLEARKRKFMRAWTVFR